MRTTFYKIHCITNLHVGSGEINYNIVDNEVEKDSVTGLPIIHASGIKGALRDSAEKDPKYSKDAINAVFGSSGDKEISNAGTHKFLDAYLIARPMRIANDNSMASIPVVTVASINHFLSMVDMFNVNSFGISKIDTPDFGDAQFLANVPGITVEGEKTALLEGSTLEQLKRLKDVIGEKFALAKSFDGYDLPVVARNHLESGVSKNLWYEEYVPHGSVFYFAVISPDNDDLYQIPDDVQFGGNSSIGYGFTKVTKL